MTKVNNHWRELEFWLKQRVSASLPMFKLQKVSVKACLEAFEPHQHERFHKLCETYSLKNWDKVCSESEFLGNLCTLDILHQILGASPLHGPGLDIGSRGFWYAPALHSFLNTSWVGVEVDAYQRYVTGHTRKAYAEYMIGPFENMSYQPQSLTEIEGVFGCITWFLPYILPGPMQSSGLPDRFFNPEALFEHAWQLLAQDGQLLIINQGKEEAWHQQALLQKMKRRFTSLGKVESVFPIYTKDRYAFLVYKN
jgi:hypothetical protein